MIDDPEKTATLIAEMRESLPLEARPTRDLVRLLSERLSRPAPVTRCIVERIHYAGEEGGIVCTFNMGGHATEGACHVSITHLIFERKTPLFRQIDAYQRHRVKKLRQQGEGGY